MLDLQLQGKTAMVCGSTQGIGWATALMLSQMGANVVMVGRDQEKIKQKIMELHFGPGQEHHFLVADFRFPDGLKLMVEDYLSMGNKIHILVNNTGGPAAGPILQANIHQFIEAFSLHLVCNQLLAQAVIPVMREAGYGRIVNVISTSVKQPLNGLGVSNTIRGAVANWAKTLANEVGEYGITVNNVLPGATMTQRLENIIATKSQKQQVPKEQIKQAMLDEIPLKRFAKPEEVAAAITFLCSAQAAYINGINLPVDGGRTGCL